MKIATPVPLSGTDKLYEYRADPRFSPGVRRKSRLFTAILPCLTGLGSLYQAIASVRDRRDFPPPGRLVDIDGCRLHLQTAGHGPPSVVLESGLGGMSAAWGWIQPETAKFSSVVSYDRAGLGWSGPDLAPKTATLAARRLRALLLKSGVLPPYVLVGHSMGGLFVRVFAALFPDEVAGMVLLDAVHPDQHLRSAAVTYQFWHFHAADYGGRPVAAGNRPSITWNSSFTAIELATADLLAPQACEAGIVKVPRAPAIREVPSPPG